MHEKNGVGVSRRAIFGSALDRTISGDEVVGVMIDRLVPESTPQLQRLRELQEWTDTPAAAILADAIGQVLRVFPVNYTLEIDSDSSTSHASKPFALGATDIVVSHVNGYRPGRWQEARVLFNPDDASVEEVAFNFNVEDGLIERSDIGTFDEFKPVIKMNSEEEDAYMGELKAYGFYDFDYRIILEALYQAVVFGERSTYWEDVARSSLCIEEISAFNKAWFRELLSNRGIHPDLFEVASRTLPVRESIGIIKGAESVGRFDIMRHMGRRLASRTRDLFTPHSGVQVPRRSMYEDGDHVGTEETEDEDV